MRFHFVLLCCLLALNVPSLAAEKSTDSHPWLFLTSTDVQRARRSLKEKPFAALARELIDRARANRIEALPPLEMEWWNLARTKKWKDTYQEVYHHSWKVPGTWSALALDCARASLLEKSKDLAAKGKEILLRLSVYTFEFEHFDVGMNYTVWGAETLEAYDILYPLFTDAERARMDAFFMRMLAAVQKSDAYWVAEEPGGTVNNHYAWHKLCYVMLGLFYDRPELVEQAFAGPKGIEFMLQHGFKDDGLWIEGSIPYQFAATEPLLQIAELLENHSFKRNLLSRPSSSALLRRDVSATLSSIPNGGEGRGEEAQSPRSLYALETKDGRTLLQSYRALFGLLWPDRTLPAVGDAYGLRPHLGKHAGYETLYRRFRDPAFAWLLADRRERSAAALFGGLAELKPVLVPEQFTKVWPEMGYLALRSNEGTNYWSGQGWSVFATFSHWPIHQHADKLSLGLFAEGHLWLPDIECRSSAEHAFSSDVQSQLNRHTLSHNTVVVDGERQTMPRQPLELIEFSSLPHVKRATFGDLRGQLYPGVRQLRTVIVTTNYVFDFFQVQSEQPHQFAWVTHVDGRSVSCSASDFVATELPSGPGWPYLREARSADAGKHFSETFRDDVAGGKTGKAFQLDLWSDNPLQVVRCDFPLKETANPPTIAMRMAQCKTGKAWFLAIYRIGSGSIAPLEATVEQGPLQTWEISVGTAGRNSAKHVVPRLMGGPK